jgi:Phage integrase, N-terminal SAM-like domain
MAVLSRMVACLMPSADSDTAIRKPEQDSPRPRLLDEVRRRLRLKHYSLRTEKAYLYWIRRYIHANGRRHPREIAVIAVERFSHTPGHSLQAFNAPSTTRSNRKDTFIIVMNALEVFACIVLLQGPAIDGDSIHRSILPEVPPHHMNDAALWRVPAAARQHIHFVANKEAFAGLRLPEIGGFGPEHISAIAKDQIVVLAADVDQQLVQRRHRDGGLEVIRMNQAFEGIGKQACRPAFGRPPGVQPILQCRSRHALSFPMPDTTRLTAA